MKLTLLQRPGRVAINDFHSALENQLSSLESQLSAQARILGFSRTGWAQIDVTGQDHEILEELVSREFDRAASNLHQVQPFGNYPGLIVSHSKDRLEVDIGIESPKLVRVVVCLGTLRAQLCDGEQRSTEEIVDSYCLYPESKITIRISRLEQDSGLIEGWLADSSIASLAQSVSTNLQCVNLYHCTRSQVEHAVRKTNLERDIVLIDTKTLTTHSIVCKLGTDAVGLIPKLGSVLRKSELKPFIPSRILSRCKKW